MLTTFFLLVIALSLFRVNDNCILSVDKSNVLKAFFPYLIIMHHVSQKTGNFTDFRWVGPYGVGVFFFISGYGLEYKHSKGKLDALSLFVRTEKVLLPLILPVFVFLLLLSEDGVPIVEYTLDKLKAFSIVFPYTWFVLTLLIMYASYFLLSSILGGGKLFVAEFLFLLFFSYVMIKLRMDGTTFITTYCFLAGAMYNYWEKNINRYQHCIVFVVVVFLLLLTTTLLALSAPIFKGYAAFGALVWTVCFIFLYTKMNVQYNKVFDHLKRISYDVFLCQGIAFYLLEEKAGVEDHLLYAVLSIILSVAFGETCYYVRQIAWHKKIDSERFTNQ